MLFTIDLANLENLKFITIEISQFTVFYQAYKTVVALITKLNTAFKQTLWLLPVAI